MVVLFEMNARSGRGALYLKVSDSDAARKLSDERNAWEMAGARSHVSISLSLSLSLSLIIFSFPFSKATET